jgi:hypothetical protein
LLVAAVVVQAVQGKLLPQTPAAVVALAWRRPLQAPPSLEQLVAEALIPVFYQSMERQTQAMVAAVPWTSWQERAAPASSS